MAWDLAQRLDPGPISAALVSIPGAEECLGDLAKLSAFAAQKGRGDCWQNRHVLQQSRIQYPDSMQQDQYPGVAEAEEWG